MRSDAAFTTIIKSRSRCVLSVSGITSLRMFRLFRSPEAHRENEDERIALSGTLRKHVSNSIVLIHTRDRDLSSFLYRNLYLVVEFESEDCACALSLHSLPLSKSRSRRVLSVSGVTSLRMFCLFRSP